MKDFVAFQAMVSLLKSAKKEHLLTEVYNKCKAQEELPKEEMENYVQELYAQFTDDEISARIAQIVTPDDIEAEVDVLYQSIDNLHIACPNHLGDWYFSGDYPTPGGNKVVNKAFINYIEGNSARAY
jgi:amidophosphoribosyltransferase